MKPIVIKTVWVGMLLFNFFLYPCNYSLGKNDPASLLDREWDIQFTQKSLDCANSQVCYELELKNTSGSSWTLGDQNYRFFFDGDLMEVTSVTSLLPTAYYGPANIDQNMTISGQGQQAASPLDDIDDNLGFLDFSIVQMDKSNPPGATQLLSDAFTPVAEICVNVAPEVFQDASGMTCLAFYHSRPSTAGFITNQYIVLSENDAPNSTVPATGVNFDDLNFEDGGAACVGPFCDPCVSLGGDSDSDGVCDDEDCAPLDPNIPATPGTTCDDGDSNTVNDVYLADGCTCSGTFDPCASQGGDTDSDGVCDDEDCAPLDPNIPATPGTTCDDGDSNTVNDVYLADGCTCSGTFDPCASQGGDTDSDGVCDDEDCGPLDPNIPAIPGTTCDDGDSSAPRHRSAFRLPHRLRQRTNSTRSPTMSRRKRCCCPTSRTRRTRRRAMPTPQTALAPARWIDTWWGFLLIGIDCVLVTSTGS